MLLPHPKREKVNKSDTKLISPLLEFSMANVANPDMSFAVEKKC